ncbi:type VII secretion system-associated protein [Amycolatopsis speibonae]|uniref:Type VII secretion system-associated protein n=1 Tax=Amycolatopsis speibonae TaxID=1450224 RepID=A0ABV7PBG0_9PSEU
MTDSTDNTQAEGPLENWFLLMDPAWRPASVNDSPPIESVVGLWPLEEEGKLGKFRANPDYVPTDENSPSDPLDAVLRLVMQGGAEAEHIQLLLRDTLFDIAMNGDGNPLITKSPDDILCVVVATGEPHRQRLASPDWRRIDLGELVELLPDGVDVLFNPAGPAAVRLDGEFMRETLDMDDEQIAGLYAKSNQDVSGLRVVTWEPTADDAAAPKASESRPDKPESE